MNLGASRVSTLISTSIPWATMKFWISNIISITLIFTKVVLVNFSTTCNLLILPL
jgi:hypothetical protein